MANKVRFGLEKLYTAKVTNTGGVISFGSPVSFPGAVSITEENRGDEAEFWADNMAYYLYRSSTGKDVTLTVAEVPDAFKTDYLGYEADENGVLVEVSGADRAYFALLYEFDGDEHATKHCLYYCKAALSSLEGETIGDNGTEPQTTEITITALPRPDNKAVKISTADATDATVIADWYQTVYEPDFGS